MMTIEAQEVQQPPEREREIDPRIDPRRYYLPIALGWLPADLEQLQREAKYPLQERER